MRNVNWNCTRKASAISIKGKSIRVLGSLALAAFLNLQFGAPQASAESLFYGCPSKAIINRFIEFGRSGKMPRDLGRWLNNPAAQKVKPWQPFDNVDYVGICWVSAWLIHTTEGSVLIDTLYGRHTKQLIANLKSIGTNFSKIKYVLITHGHFDHAGGAVALKPLLPNARFVMTKQGWDEAIESADKSKGRRAWKMIKPDIVAGDGYTIKLGDNVFRVLATPGHSWGTASFTYDVKDSDKTYRAVTIGGLGLNAIKSLEQVEAYIKSVERIRGLVGKGGEMVVVHLTTHGFSNRLEENRQKHMKRVAGEPNIFVNPKGILKQVGSLRGRAVKRREREKQKAKK